jgi:hypothetical protein
MIKRLRSVAFAYRLLFDYFLRWTVNKNITHQTILITSICIEKKKQRKKSIILTQQINISLIKNNHVSSFQITIFMTVFWKKSILLEDRAELGTFIYLFI